MVKEDLKYKYIEAKDFYELEKKVDEFNKINLIRAQVDHGYLSTTTGAGVVIHKAWCHVFYLPREISRESTEAMVDITPQDETKYQCKCTVCNSFFNFLKYPRCSGGRHGVEGVPEELKPYYDKTWGKKN